MILFYITACFLAELDGSSCPKFDNRTAVRLDKSTTHNYNWKAPVMSTKDDKIKK